MPETTIDRATKKKTNGKSTAPIPIALAALAERAGRAGAAVHARDERLLRQARELLAHIKRRKADIADAFYDIGEALARLHTREMIAALGRRTFAEVCEKDAGLPASTGERLVEVVTTMTREQAIALGSKKAMATVSLAEATPAKQKPAGPRRKKAVTVKRRTTTIEERQLAALLEKRLRQLGLDRVRVTAVATKPGQGAELRFEHVPAAKVDLLKKAIGR